MPYWGVHPRPGCRMQNCRISQYKSFKKWGVSWKNCHPQVKTKIPADYNQDLPMSYYDVYHSLPCWLGLGPVVSSTTAGQGRSKTPTSCWERSWPPWRMSGKQLEKGEIQRWPPELDGVLLGGLWTTLWNTILRNTTFFITIPRNTKNHVLEGPLNFIHNLLPIDSSISHNSWGSQSDWIPIGWSCRYVATDFVAAPHRFFPFWGLTIHFGVWCWDMLSVSVMENQSINK
jgi:hypothetical protein